MPTKISGKSPFRFLFNTAATVTIVGNRAAAVAGLTGMRAVAETFEVGEAPCVNLVVGSADAMQPLDGVVGFTFFSPFRVTLHYPKHEIAFEPLDPARVRCRRPTAPAHRLEVARRSPCCNKISSSVSGLKTSASKPLKRLS